jgi:hypothetical protein
MVSILHDDDFGFDITITFISRRTGLALDISATTTQRVDIRNTRDDTVRQNTAAFVTDGTDGQIRYRATASEFDSRGRWEVQGVAFGASARFATDPEPVDVRVNLVDV